MNDIVTAFTAPVVIGKLSIPSLPLGFFWAGGCSLLQTFLFLILLRRRGVVFYVLLTPVIYGFDVLLGIFIFTDPVSKQELGFFIPLVVILLLVIGVQKWFASSKYTDADQITSMAEPSRRDGLQIAAFVVLAIALNSATHMIQRGVIYGLRLSDPTRTTGVALAFRAAYFSVFAVYGFFWVGSKILSNSKRRAQNIRKDQESRADPPLTLKALRLASVTALTGGFALLLQASPISSNLAIGPLATNSARIIVAPLVVALYAVEGRALQLLPRIVGAYGGLGSRRLGKLGNRLLVGLGIILFALLSLVIILWTITKLGFRLDLPTIPFG